MKQEFPGAVPEMPVSDIDKAAAYYVSALGFVHEWGDDAGGIAGVSRGQCRIFLTNPAFRQMYGNAGPVLIWLNLDSREAVNELHAHWSGRAARILSPPESKPWKLHEFTATDLDGNLIRVFYDFAWEERRQS
jgi:predicted lactoylglutathione lyase